VISQASAQQIRTKITTAANLKAKRDQAKAKKKKKQRAEFLAPDVSEMEQFALCDAMRYISPNCF
jgi:hypothetical protein